MNNVLVYDIECCIIIYGYIDYIGNFNLFFNVYYFLQ